MANVVTVQVSSQDTSFPGATIDVNLAQVQMLWLLDERTGDCMLRFANGEGLRVTRSELTDSYIGGEHRVGSFERFERFERGNPRPSYRWVNLDLVRWIRPTHQERIFEITWATGGEPLAIRKAPPPGDYRHFKF
jgi:hypothetical protein